MAVGETLFDEMSWTDLEKKLMFEQERKSLLDLNLTSPPVLVSFW